jgi:predicted nucleic-acid-binding Zn-ribbon protein
MSAQILDIDQHRATRALCLNCNHVWFMPEEEPEFDPHYDKGIECPKCHNVTGAYSASLIIAGEDEDFESPL